MGDLPFLNERGRARLKELLRNRLAGVPLAHLLGWQNFMGLELRAGPQALIPRKETEILGKAALGCLRELIRSRGYAKVIDVCTGSGNLALALAAAEPVCEVCGADISSKAIALAEENARLHGLEGRVQFRSGDLFAPFGEDFHGKVDLIVCNPPYLPSGKARSLPREIADFEPREAFDAGMLGVSIITRLIAEAPSFLAPQSWLCFEVGMGQGPFFISRLKALDKYKIIESATDTAGFARAIMAAV
jgi:release factor glutamine methyltransferase